MSRKEKSDRQRSWHCAYCGEANATAYWQGLVACKECRDELANGLVPPGMTDPILAPNGTGLCARQRYKKYLTGG